MVVEVHPRVARRHPEVTDDEVREAFENSLRFAPRMATDPMQWVGVGVTHAGRLLEYLAVKPDDPEDWLIFHSMDATTKVKQEVGLERRRR
ncbi:hypothetical protein DEI81_12025 [Curtobacterium sp. MCBD17_013]|uniref:hypothetical protein n=1 Tax=unclassified Curtobacterium TaxID=257496 RepID=UPI000DA8C721|nr:MULTISPECIES: hypothetical protein [unclassified Curtobacterium]PZF60724.1 hypothetical protein DEI81_12025 [Curtobacterium sp. MCBD17_013]WIB66835.1 hypothetical protein DEI93_12830 [Curtobacterium sp. MCBD17_035]WIE53975.1 hypothetical protein DEI88_012720 [Curtobacterium sp. MCBD17_003]